MTKCKYRLFSCINNEILDTNDNNVGQQCHWYVDVLNWFRCDNEKVKYLVNFVYTKDMQTKTHLFYVDCNYWAETYYTVIEHHKNCLTRYCDNLKSSGKVGEK